MQSPKLRVKFSYSYDVSKNIEIKRVVMGCDKYYKSYLKSSKQVSVLFFILFPIYFILQGWMCM